MRNLIRLPATLLALAMALSSCTTMETQTAGEVVATAPESVRAATVSLPPETGPGSAADASGTMATAESTTEVSSGPTLYQGTDELIRMPKAREPVRFFGEDVSLNFEQAPLTEVIHAVMGDILELDYVVEHPIGGEVTLRTRTPVPRDQLLDILESLLKANGALMLRDDEGRFFVSGSGQMSRLKPSVAASASGVVGFSTIIVPLQFISASSMADILRPVAEEGSFVRIDNLRNILMLAGTRSQLLGWQEMIETFDVDMLKGMSVGIFPIENSSIEEMEVALASLLGTGGAGGGDPAVEALSGIGSVVRIIPVPRLSSILVVTPRAHYLQRIKTWIERLDEAPAANYEKRLYVYKVQNSNAEHLATLLSEIYGGTGGSSGQASTGVAPGFTPETVSSNGRGAESAASAGGSSNNSKPSNYTVGGVTVVADDENNALLIYATGREYRKIEPALKQLDVAATQVIIEASIVEVTLDDSLEYGLEWAFNDDFGGGKTGLGQLVNGTTAIGATAPGFAYSVLNGSGTIKAVLNALASKNLLNVISSPSVMVLDNQTATIQVGDQVPVNAGSTTTEVGVVTNISYRDTGVQLTVTPSVNAGGMVTMDIEQSVTDVNESDTSDETEPSFLERKITSRVAVRSSESIVLGGLIRENKSNGSSGIPFLHEIPVLGALFGAKKSTDRRTELLVIITPRAIYSDSELRDVSREMRSQMRGLKLIDESETSAFLSDPKLEENAEPIRNR